jgi:hypothetical protein
MTTVNLWVDRRQAINRVAELSERVHISDLTTLEILAMLAVLEPADERVNARPAPVLRLAPGMTS